MAETEDVRLSVDDGIAVVALNKPARRNAISSSMWHRLAELFTGFRARADVRVVILTGTEGHFSAGADISEFHEVRGTEDAAAAYAEAGRIATVAIRDLPQPTIAAVHGYAVGGGCGLALACDLRVGDQTSKMGIPAARRGIVYSIVDTENLLFAVGLPRAKLVLYSGRVFPAAECRTMGLLDEMSDAGALPGARALARELAERAPLSQSGAKITLAAIARGELNERADEIAEAQRIAATSEDFHEATRSFLEKRRPVFRGV